MCLLRLSLNMSIVFIIIVIGGYTGDEIVSTDVFEIIHAQSPLM